jgi:hypothetical protein
MNMLIGIKGQPCYLPIAMKTKILLLCIAAFLCGKNHAQNSDWTNFYNSSQVKAIVTDKQFSWLATGHGLVKMNQITGEKIFYTSENSWLPSNQVLSLAMDKKGKLWIGTNEGLSVFDGTTWTLIQEYLAISFILLLSIPLATSGWEPMQALQNSMASSGKFSPKPTARFHRIPYPSSPLILQEINGLERLVPVL